MALRVDLQADHAPAPGDRPRPAPTGFRCHHAAMTETISDRYRRRSALVAATIDAVPPAAWAAQSPCDDWTARDVVRHLVDTQGMFAGMVGRELEPGPAVDEDPGGAWAAANGQTQAALDDPELAAVEFDGVTGRSTFAAATDRFLSLDLVAHRWDLATAAGLDATIPEVDLAAAEEAVAALAGEVGAMMRQGGAFGPELTPPADADRQTKLLAFLGRQAW